MDYNLDDKIEGGSSRDAEKERRSSASTVYNPQESIMGRIELVSGEAPPVDPGRRVLWNNARYYQLSYRGGQAYKNGKDAEGQATLIPHESESEEGIKRRKRMSAYRNYCRPVCDWYRDSVYTRQVARELSNPKFSDFMGNADMLGTDLHEIMKRSTTNALITGEHWLVVDSSKEDIDPVTVAQAEVQNSRLFVIDYDIWNCLGYRLRGDALVQALFQIGNEVRLYDEDSVQIGMIDEQGRINGTLDINHGFGMIPVVRVTAFDDGHSMLNDLADLNKLHFNLGAVLAEELMRQTFTSWAVLGVSADDLTSASVGGRKVLCINKNATEVKFERLGGDPSQSESLRKSMAETVDDIYRAAGLSKPELQKSGGPESGRALLVRQEEVSRTARAIADQAEKAEFMLTKIWAAGMDSEVPASPQYPNKFNAEALESDLRLAMDAVKSELPTSLVKGLLKQVGRAVLELDEEGTIEFEKELEEFNDEADNEPENTNNGPGPIVEPVNQDTMIEE